MSPPPPAKSALTAAFTLIELSIVLVIIGLVVGGILVGRDLIRQAEMRALISDVDKIRTAIHTFQEKYNCLPGDCLNATDFFGTASGGCPSGARSGTQTCNGNGDGDINNGYWNSFWFVQTPLANIEPFLFWQHLANAGLWSGNYTGVSAAAGAYNGVAEIGVNIPASKVTGGGGYMVADFSDGGTDPNFAYATADYSRSMLFGANWLDWGANLTPVMTGREMLALDTKIDDGKPQSGTVITQPPWFNAYMGVPACVTSREPTTATYIVSDTVACSPFFGKMWE
jgi:prepilin-type N-terminal cleavage/methylation domain-containing protein